VSKPLPASNDVHAVVGDGQCLAVGQHVGVRVAVSGTRGRGQGSTAKRLMYSLLGAINGT
jgi:hypothetical protein